MRKLVLAALLLISTTAAIAPPLTAQSGVAVAIRSGSIDPGTCSTGGRNVFFNRTTGLLKLCTAPNTWSAVGAASGDAVGPASSTDNAVARFDGATGKLLQNSTLLVSDAGAISGASLLAFTTAGNMGYAAGVGPTWTDVDLVVTQRHDIQNLSATRTATWPDINGTVGLISATATTVGAAGPADALPATPLGYLTITLPSGTAVKVPYYTP